MEITFANATSPKNQTKYENLKTEERRYKFTDEEFQKFNLYQVKVRTITAAYFYCERQIGKAAQLIGTDRRTMQRWVQALELKTKEQE